MSLELFLGSFKTVLLSYHIGKEFQRRGAAAANARSPRVGKVIIANDVSRIVLLDLSPYLEFCLRETS